MATDNWNEAKEANAQSDKTWDQKEPLIGQFLGTKSDVGPNNSEMHNFRDDNGENIGVWGSAVLDNKMKDVPVGSRTKVEFLGKKENPKTNREFKDYSVVFFPPETKGVEPAGAPIVHAPETSVQEDIEQGVKVDTSEVDNLFPPANKV